MNGHSFGYGMGFESAVEMTIYRGPSWVYCAMSFLAKPKDETAGERNIALGFWLP